MRLDRRSLIESTTPPGLRIRFDARALFFLLLFPLTAGSAGAQSPAWADDPLLPGVTQIKAVHFTELRTRINKLLTGCGGTAFAFTDPTLTANETRVRAVHVTDLRTALGRAYDACGRSRPTWSEPAPERGSTAIPGQPPSRAARSVRSAFGSFYVARVVLRTHPA